MIKVTLNMRMPDDWGQGNFGASRGSRTHNGVDLACWPDAILTSPVKGRVTKINNVYSDPDKSRYLYVEVTDDDELRHRFFYVKPSVKVGEIVDADEPLGSVQDIRVAYSNSMTPHVHYEIIHKGKYLDPTPFAIGGA